VSLLTALRAGAIGMAIIGLVDPSWTAGRRVPVAVDIKVDRNARPAADEVRKRLVSELRNDVSLDSSAEPSAVIMIGGVEPMRTVRDGVPVSTVSLSEAPAPDIRIVAAADPSPVPVGWAATFTATVEGRGLAGKTSRLVLEDRGAELAHLDLKWTSDSERIQASLRYTPPAAGTSVVTVRAVPADGETVATDNAADVRLVATGRQLKVLVHEPRPSWNAIFVRRALEEDPTFNVAARAQASRGLDVSAGNAPPALTAEALSGFDVVIVGAPEDLRASDVEALRSFARRRGGGVVLLPDKRPTGSYLGLLPVPQFDEVLVDGAVELRPGASSGSVLRASELVVPRSLGAAGDVLLAMQQSKSTRPVVVEYPLGAGRVLFSGAMDAWRYRASADDGFGRFWRTRIAEAALAAPPRLEVSLVPGVPRPGDDVVVNVRIRATEWHDTSAGTRMPALSARLISPDGPGSDNSKKDEGVRLWPTTEPGLFQGRITAPKAGLYNLSVSSEGGATGDDILAVVSDARHPAPNAVAAAEELTTVSSITGGVAVSANDLEALVQHFRGLPSSQAARRVHPARTMFFLFAFVALASAEWTMRRRRGLK
jgi:hypothetical protein